MPPTRVAFTRRAARAASGATQVMPALIAGGTRDGKGARFTCDTRRSTAVATNTPLSSRGLALRCSHIPVAHFKVVIPAKRATRARAGTHGRGGAPGDRKSGVEGKRVSVRVDFGGRRIIKKK